ncbi:MAG: hypothetical protein IJU68_04645 [Bacteroidales bacterium]|nr:hypothetical protein [Bacteroidales bacterium]
MDKHKYLVPQTEWISADERDLLASSISDGDPIVGPSWVEGDYYYE